MKYLLDTHVLLWYFDDFGKLPKYIIEIIENLENNIYVSNISILEIVIKKSLNKLELSLSIDELYYHISSSSIILLDIKKNHLNVYSTLPYLHKDPFDRYLISVSIAEDLFFLTQDKNIQLYDIKWIW
ncbi:MAG: type II toxin-antitoxin system VapC family toxin [Candidatus Cloacimonetes bacterium]|nr:type II toxin-antitoxin system VapC family toxin [Candidatus Cloacimonadota bacterium]